MSEPIEVVVHMHETLGLGGPDLAEYRLRMLVMQRLKDAGAPVEGTFYPEIKNGTLEHFDLIHNGNRVYRWTP